MRLLAFHLPQFHPVPENDEWWGKGFTEWTNVTKARPLFKGHHQPHLPADLGFYDLRLPEARIAQADLARAYGISAFVYYHYWFNGRRILQRPVDEIVSSGEPNFPFCLCWANENWTRRWDGREGSRENLLTQTYSDEDDANHIRHLLPILSDPRYVRVDGKPLLIVYRIKKLPNPSRSSEIWRSIAIQEGVGEIFLANVEALEWDIDPRTMGFDAAIEFAPDWRFAQATLPTKIARAAAKLHPFPTVHRHHSVVHYPSLMKGMNAKQDPKYRRFPCVTPGFDNSSRRKEGSMIFVDSSPELYRQWLSKVIEKEMKRQVPDAQKLVFINAWNEWAEGNHLEPDSRWGHEYLLATRHALEDVAGSTSYAI